MYTLQEVYEYLLFWRNQGVTLEQLIEMLESDPNYVFPTERTELASKS